MNPQYPIFVISKGRSKSCLTVRELVVMNVPFTLVVEPQEFDDYSKEWPNVNIIKTPFSNLGEGSVPVRNYVFDLSVEQGVKRHWILDDNIEGFHRLHNNEKHKVADGTIFKCCEDFVDRYENISMAGMNYYSLCKKTDGVPPFILNTRIYSCILLNNSISERWRGRFNEDTDLSLRILKSGKCTVLFNAFLCGKVTTMRMSGGNTEEVYGDTNNRLEFAESLVSQHPDVVKVTFKFGRYHHQVDYKPFKNNTLIFRGDFQIPSGHDNYGMKLSTVSQITTIQKTNMRTNAITEHFPKIIQDYMVTSFTGQMLDQSFGNQYYEFPDEGGMMKVLEAICDVAEDAIKDYEERIGNLTRVIEINGKLTSLEAKMDSFEMSSSAPIVVIPEAPLARLDEYPVKKTRAPRADKGKSRKKCVACEGSGKNSKGEDCPICKEPSITINPVVVGVENPTVVGVEVKVEPSFKEVWGVEDATKEQLTRPSSTPPWLAQPAAPVFFAPPPPPPYWNPNA